jgi:flagellar motor switch protein FliG
MAPVSTTEQASPLRKAAILLITLGEETSAELMQQLSQAEVRQLCEETARVKEISGEQTESVLREFYQLTSGAKNGRSGGLEFTQRMLTRVMGPDNAKKLLAEAANPVAAGFAKMEPLVKADPAQVARSLSTEHPQTIALVVAHLPTDQAASLLTELPASLRGEVVFRMARLDQITPEVVAQIAEAIGEKFGKQAGISREAYGGVRIVADLCNRLDPNISQEVLQNMESVSPETAERIRKVMFVFDDVLKLDDMAMSEINSRVDRKTLVLALKGTSEQLKEHFTKKMSSRAREMLLEDLDALGPVKLRDVDEAQQELINVIRQLEQEGVISSRGAGDSGGKDRYVS